MQNKLIKIALKLKSKGLDKIADQVLNLNKKLQRQKDNERILKEKKEQDRLSAIYEQHDKDDLKPEFAYPSDMYSVTQKRYQVSVAYPSFDEEGSPYFDNECVTEKLTMTEKDLENYKRQEQMGQVKLLSVRPILPKSR